MLDLNRLLLFIAVLSPLVVLIRTARHATLNRDWQLAAVVVLGLTTAAWLVVPSCAGWAGGTAWLLFLFLPAAGLRRAADLVAQERCATARWILAILRWLHPAKAVRDEVVFLRAMEAAQNGNTAAALQLLETLHRADSHAGLQAIAQTFRIQGDWAGLVEWSRNTLPLVALGREPNLLPLYFRALGETGALDELVLQVAGRAPALLASPQHQGIFDASLLMMFAFTGRTDSVTQLLKTRLGGFNADAQDFWIATSRQAAGELETSRIKLESLRRETQNALLRAEIEQRLSRARSSPAAINPITDSTVRRFEKDLPSAPRPFLSLHAGPPAPAVSALIILNAVMFFFEIKYGGPTNPRTLLFLGGLEPVAVFARGEYWRLLAALFLHYGPLHLIINLYALYVLGPALEGSIGSIRFAFCYLMAGLGSTAGVAGLWKLGWTKSELLVGASGAVMGIVGTWAGLLLRHRHLPSARRYLLSIGLIVLIQTAFDFFTPQVSMAAHLCGLASGLLLGLVIAPRNRESS